MHYIIYPKEGIVEDNKDVILSTQIKLADEGAKVITLGNYSSEFKGWGYLVNNYSVMDEWLHLFVFDGEIALDFYPYKDYHRDELLSSDVILVDQFPTTYGEFYEQQLASESFFETNRGRRLNSISEQEAYNFITRNIDEQFTKNRKGLVDLTGDQGILEELRGRRFISVYYEVDFEAGEEKEVSVSYLTEPSYERDEGEEFYTIDYLLSPAQYWKSFGTLTIELQTGNRIKELIESSVSLEEVDKGRYIYEGDGLPSEELHITVKDSGFSSYKLRGFIQAAFLAVILLGIILVFLAITKMKRR